MSTSVDASSRFVTEHPIVSLVIGLVVIAVVGVLLYLAVKKGRKIKVWGIEFTFGTKKEEPSQEPPKTKASSLQGGSTEGSSGRSDAATAPEETDLDTTRLLWTRAFGLYGLFRNNTPHNVLNMEVQYEVTNDYSMRIATRSMIVSLGQPVFALVFRRGSTDTPVRGFGPLQLRVHGAPGKTVHWLPTSDSVTRKSFVVFFSPPLLVGEPAYELFIDSEWPGAAKRLASIGVVDEHEIAHPRGAVGDLPRLMVTLKLPAKGHSYRVEFENRTVHDLPDTSGSHLLAADLGPLRQGQEAQFTVRRLT